MPSSRPIIVEMLGGGAELAHPLEALIRNLARREALGAFRRGDSRSTQRASYGQFAFARL